MNCKECTPTEKPIKFYWKDNTFYMYSKEPEEDLDDVELMVEYHLGLQVPVGISDFEICIACQEVLGNPEHQPLYEKLTNDILKDIVALHAEAVVANSDSNMKEKLDAS